jgi:parallel beta-helix repeat protein
LVRHVAGFLAVLLLATAVHGATVCVNPGGTGGCFASVQAAVDAAAAGDLVTIAAGTYGENVFIVGKSLDLQGDDPTTTLIDAGGNGTAITVQGPGTVVTITRLGMQNAGPTDHFHGLAAPFSKVTLMQCRITGNVGAGLSDDLGVFGGIKRSRLTVVDTTIAGNDSAGIVLSAYSRVKVVRSTISGNGQSGMFLRGRGSRATVQDSTISGNTTTGNGGGIYLVASSLKLVRSTVASNAAAGAGGGVFADFRGRVRSEATILADNVHMGGAANECALGPPSNAQPGGRFLSQGFNLIEGACASVGSTALDVTGQDPLLGPLQDNGGSTFTRAPMAGSPALGVVTRDRTCLEPDQRGVPRAAPCDVGAYETP